MDGPANASPDDPHDQPLDASLLPSQLLTVEVLRRPVESALVGWIFMVLLVVGAVAVLVWGAASGRAFWARGDQNAEERSALHILEDRFASGEINREEFERRRAILTRR